MVAYARGSPCRQPSCPGGPIAAGARCLSLLKVVNTGAPKIPHHESWSPGDACTKPRRAFNSLLEKEPKSGKALARARPAGPSGHQLAATQIAPARPCCPTLLWDITITAPRAALAHENGLTAANPWGCPPPGGGCASLRAPRAVPQGVEEAGRRGGRAGRPAQPRAPILCPPIGMLKRRRSRSARGRARANAHRRRDDVGP